MGLTKANNGNEKEFKPKLSNIGPNKRNNPVRCRLSSSTVNHDEQKFFSAGVDFSLFDQIAASLQPQMRNTRILILSSVCLAFVSVVKALSHEPELGSARVVFQTSYGDIEFGFYPTVAPKTVDHIFKLVRLGGYNTNHFFRVDKGFVAQVADVANGRSAPMNEEQRKEAEKKIVGEFSDVKHVRGTLSMGRYDDPDSAQSSFSMLLGDAPHLDRQYAVFGKVTRGDETLKKLEEVPTRREGIFVMPTERITILSTYYYDTKMESCEEERYVLKRRLQASFMEVERQRMKCFP